ncbi:MAG: hypothetical protein H7099_21125 [Gemmatimonadaceae bacterium]|nr:hypothetical protein [Gemmatimonadaceae bacterium]
MRSALAGAVMVLGVCAVPATEARAQVALGYTDAGVVLGLGNVGNANIAFGGRFERIFRKLPDLGDGLLGIGVSADYYSYSNGGGGYTASVKVLPIGATANYHFKIDPKKKLDAFLGAGLGYQVVTCSYNGPGGSTNFCSNSAVYFIGRAGGRYFLKPNLAVYADAGAGAATLSVGLTFKLK